MNIGEEEPAITIEPVVDPVPGDTPAAPEETPTPVEVPEAEPVPA